MLAALTEPVRVVSTATMVYMPITPMFHVHAWGFLCRHPAGRQADLSGRYVPEQLLSLIQRENVTFSHCVPTILQMLLASSKVEEIDLSRWKVTIGGRGAATSLGQTGARSGRGYLHRLRHVRNLPLS
ncbi:MAG: AMP-binding protein [Candidatus Competibacteraceae bacterium]